VGEEAARVEGRRQAQGEERRRQEGAITHLLLCLIDYITLVFIVLIGLGL